MKFAAFLLASVLAAAVPGAGAAAAAPLRIAYAGSMGAVMDQQVGPAFEKAHGVIYQGVGQGSYALARLLASRQMRADVFISITPGPMRILLKDGLIKQAIPVASTQMVIAYSRQSRLAAQFDAAATGKRTWYQVLELAGARFGRTVGWSEATGGSRPRARTRAGTAAA